jgi:hypothetical protein
VPATSEFSEDSAKGGKIDQNSRQPQELYCLIFVQLQLQVVVSTVVPMNGNLELPPSAKAPFLVGTPFVFTLVLGTRHW